jgi:hypothetical protein
VSASFRTLWAQNTERPLRIAKRVTTIALLLFALFLIFADKPWDSAFFERVEQGKKPKLEHFIEVGLYGAALINLALCALLLMTARGWARSIPALDDRQREPPPKTPLWFWIGLALAVLLGGVLRWNLAHGSMWWDEIWPLRNAIVGKLAPDEKNPAELKFRPVSWAQTFFNYSKPTNHVPYSVAARATVDVWRKLTGREPHEFSNFTVHLPALLAGLASIFFMGMLVKEWGFPIAGVGAAFFLAIHSWHIRHSAEARAYTFVILLVILALLWLTRGLRTGRWRYWLLFGLVHFLMLWSFPYTIFLSIPLVLCVSFAIVDGYGWKTTALQLFGRFMIANIAADMLLLMMIAPHVLQVAFWSPKNWMLVGTNFSYVLPQTWYLTITGLEHSTGMKEYYPSIGTRVRDYPWIDSFVRFVMPFFMVIGFVALLWRKTPARWLAMAFVLAPPLAIAVMALKHTTFIPRFVFYSVIGAAACTTIGIQVIGTAPFRKRGAGHIVAALGFALFLSGIFVINLPQIQIAMKNPIFPTQQVADWLREKAGASPVIAVGYGVGGTSPAVYYPWILEAGDAADIAAFSRRSREEGKPFYLFYGMDYSNRHENPNGFRLIDNPALFEKLAIFDGISPEGRHFVFRYTGKPIAEENFAPVREDEKE